MSLNINNWLPIKNSWSSGSTFTSSDVTTANSWSAQASKFKCSRKFQDIRPTTDCNAKLNVRTGACCYRVQTTDPVKEPFSLQAKEVFDTINRAGYPLQKDWSKQPTYLCSTPWYLERTPGYKFDNFTKTI